MDEKLVIYKPFDDMSFTYDKCFLCGKLLRDAHTREHVFPQWLLRRYNLWDAELVLLNKTRIKYRQLTIPCCINCNNIYLSRIENIIEDNSDKGYNQFIKLDELIVYQWVLKIFYGLLFKELSLKLELHDPNSETILNPEFLEKFRSLHLFLQSVRFKFNFNYFVPWSIFILKSHIYDNEKENFDYHDGIFSLTFSIRMGEICIFSCLEDNGSQKHIFEEYFDKFKGHPIHPIQFDEISAKIAYQSSLMNRIPKYISILPNNEKGIFEINSLPLQGFLKTPIYDEGNPRDYVKYLNLYWHRWGIKEHDIYKEPDLVFSTLENKDGTINKLDKYGNPVKN